MEQQTASQFVFLHQDRTQQQHLEGGIQNNRRGHSLGFYLKEHSGTRHKDLQPLSSLQRGNATDMEQHIHVASHEKSLR